MQAFGKTLLIVGMSLVLGRKIDGKNTCYCIILNKEQYFISFPSQTCITFCRQITKNSTCILLRIYIVEPVGLFRGESRSTSGWLIRGVAAQGIRGGGVGTPQTPGRFSKSFKKSIEDYNFQAKCFDFLIDFTGNFSSFRKCIKISS